MIKRRRAIVGICGLAGAGKSTAARYLAREKGFARRPFAYPLKAMIAALGVSAELLDSPRDAKEQPLDMFGGKSLRTALQTLGTEWGRVHFGDDFWINQWCRGIESLGDVVVDDVRFPNEAAIVRKLGGAIIKLERTGSGASVGAGHASEAVHLLRADATIQNNGSESDLFAMLDAMMIPQEKEGRMTALR